MLGGSTNNKSGFKVCMFNMEAVYICQISTICCPTIFLVPLDISVLNFSRHYNMIVWHPSVTVCFKMMNE